MRSRAFSSAGFIAFDDSVHDTFETMRVQPLIAVTDVEASSLWYQHLLECKSNHGGSASEQLVHDGQPTLKLHGFDVHHHRGAIGNRDDRPYGNRYCSGSRWTISTRSRGDPLKCTATGCIVVVASRSRSADGSWHPDKNPFE